MRVIGGSGRSASNEAGHFVDSGQIRSPIAVNNAQSVTTDGVTIGGATGAGIRFEQLGPTHGRLPSIGK